MGYRTFVDSDGGYWQVWDSQPARVERRLKGSDRRDHKPFPWRGADRRAGMDRRMTSQRRISLNEGYGAGWLTFESLDEKRRLIPIPLQWEDVSQAELRVLCDRARRIAKTEEMSSSG
jgi:hypothetical protein